MGRTGEFHGMTLTNTTCRQRVPCDGGPVPHSQTQLTVFEVSDVFAKHFGLDLVSLSAGLLDVRDAARVARELGLTGRAYVKRKGDSVHLVFKGWPAARPTLNAPVYLKTNPKVAHIAVGMRDHARAIARSSALVVVAYVSLNALEALLSDGDLKFVQFIGETAADVAKFAVSAGAGWLAAAGTGLLTASVAGPLVAAIFVGVLTSLAVERLDQEIGVTRTLLEAMRKTAEDARQGYREVGRQYWRIEEWLRSGGLHRMR